MKRIIALTILVFIVFLVSLDYMQTSAKSEQAEEKITFLMQNSFDDDFNTSVLDSKWQWIREDPTHWYFSDPLGYLIMLTQHKDIWRYNTSAPILIQELGVYSSENFEITTRVIMTPTENFHQGGLIIYEDDDNHIRFTFGYRDQVNVELAKEVNGVYEDILIPTEKDIYDFHLKIRKINTTYYGFYSADGKKWIDAGILGEVPINPYAIGITAFNGAEISTEVEIPAKFDYFKVNLLGNGNVCDVINLPLYYQGSPSTPNSLPNEPDWYDDAYGKYPDGDTDNTIGRWGCNISSNAMILDFYDRCFNNNNRTDPGVLNTWFRMNDGYDSNNYVNYANIIEYAHELGIGMSIFLGERNDELLDRHLEIGNPAMLKVQSPYGSHYVTAIGKTQLNGEDTYKINDPIWGNTTLYEHYNNTYSKVYYYTANPGLADLSHIQISALSPIHLLVTDPLGRKSGYDPRTDKTWDEIPDAGYTIDNIAEPDGTTLEETKILLLTHPIAGDYDIEAIGYYSGQYDVNVVMLNHLGGSERKYYSGVATDNSSDVFNFTYNPGSMVFLPSIQK